MNKGDNLLVKMAQILQGGESNSSELPQAIEHLNSAIDILESGGLHNEADKILNFLQKFGSEVLTKRKPVLEVPSIAALLANGLSHKDIRKIEEGDPIAIARLNKALRALGLSNEQIRANIGSKYKSEKEVEGLLNPEGVGRFWDWMKNPTDSDASGELKPGDTFSIKSVAKKKMPKELEALTSELGFDLSDEHLFSETDDLEVNDADDIEKVFDDEVD